MSSRAPTYWEGRYGVSQASGPRQEQTRERGGTRRGVREGRGHKRRPRIERAWPVREAVGRKLGRQGLRTRGVSPRTRRSGDSGLWSWFAGLCGGVGIPHLLQSPLVRFSFFCRHRLTATKQPYQVQLQPRRRQRAMIGSFRLRHLRKGRKCLSEVLPLRGPPCYAWDGSRVLFQAAVYSKINRFRPCLFLK
jgi:hypothetical protein